MSCLIFQSCGRIRVRLNILRSNISEVLLAELESLNGVKKVIPNELSGSIVIYYDRSVRCSSSLLETFRNFGLLENVYGLPTKRPSLSGKRVLRG